MTYLFLYSSGCDYLPQGDDVLFVFPILNLNHLLKNCFQNLQNQIHILLICFDLVYFLPYPRRLYHLSLKTVFHLQNHCFVLTRYCLSLLIVNFLHKLGSIQNFFSSMVFHTKLSHLIHFKSFLLLAKMMMKPELCAVLVISLPFLL